MRTLIATRLVSIHWDALVTLPKYGSLGLALYKVASAGRWSDGVVSCSFFFCVVNLLKSVLELLVDSKVSAV